MKTLIKNHMDVIFLVIHTALIVDLVASLYFQLNPHSVLETIKPFIG